MLHNPDEIGYTSEAVWQALQAAKDEGLTDLLGIAPGPANGFSLDLLDCFERFGELIDWAMLILNPLEPWPVGLTLPACEKHGVKVMTRVVDHGGVFHGDLGLPGHEFKPGDHRTLPPRGLGRARHGKSRAHAAGRGEIRPHPASVRLDLEPQPPGGGQRGAHLHPGSRRQRPPDRGQNPRIRRPA